MIDRDPTTSREPKAPRTGPSIHPISKAADKMATEELRDEILAKIDDPSGASEAEGDVAETEETTAAIMGTQEPLDAPRGRKPRRPTPSQAARAWLDRQAAERRRRPLVVTTPAQAIELWRGVQATEGGRGPAIPIAPGEGEPMRGQRPEVQAWNAVRLTDGYDRWRKGHLPREAFEAALGAWLPRTFHSPLPPLCGAELEELARGRAEIERQVEREARGDAEGRLLPGMGRVDAEGVS